MLHENVHVEHRSPYRRTSIKEVIAFSNAEARSGSRDPIARRRLLGKPCGMRRSTGVTASVAAISL